MRTLLRRCRACDRYTLQDRCPSCGQPTGNPMPPRYSPEDRYGPYRRRLKRGGESPWKAS